MKANNADLSRLQAKENQCIGNLSKMSTNQVFADRPASYINELNLYVAYFDAIPNLISEVGIDCRKAHRWFIANFENQIKDTYYNKRHLREYKTTELDDIFHFLEEDLMVDFDTQNHIIRFLYRKTPLAKVNAIIEGLKKFRKRSTRDTPLISLLVTTKSGIEVKSVKVNRTKLNITDNYNDDFASIHHTIVTRLNRKNDKGLVILHGKPGTGKTSYIRYLVATLKKNVIFMPPSMATAITNPNLISVLMDNPNSIFVIEDAENLVMDREKDGESPVSALLNITDGLLSDCLNIQIICSFNTDISKVDSALMRKGRLIAKYEFADLSLSKAQRLSAKLGFNTLLTEPMSLAAIYNQSEKDFQQKKNTKGIGFSLSA